MPRLLQVIILLHSFAPLLVRDALVCVNIEAPDYCNHLVLLCPHSIEPKEMHRIAKSQKALSLHIYRVKRFEIGPVDSSLKIEFQNFNLLVVLNLLLEEQCEFFFNRK